MFLPALMRTFQLLGKGLSRIGKLRIDVGSEGWNAALLAVVDLLFDIYPEMRQPLKYCSKVELLEEIRWLSNPSHFRCMR